MKVLLVNPACLDQRITDNDATIVPIGLYYLAAQLLDKGIDASILNLAGLGPDQDLNRRDAMDQGASHHQGQQIQRMALDEFNRRIQAEHFDVIGFSVSNPSRFNAMDCARAAKAKHPGVVTVFGGPAPTFMADHLFKACKDLDLIIKGEGEASFPAVLSVIKSEKHPPFAPDQIMALKQIKGVVFRDEQGLIDTGLPDPTPDLDRLVPPSKYFTYQHLAMSRGCPGRCTFCGSPKFWGSRHVRRHSPDWFFNEIRTLHARGVTHFFISDDTFTMDREAVIAFCEKIIHSGICITWNAISRVDYIDGPLLSAMRRAGCIQISFGVESGSEQIRKTLGKPVPDTSAAKAFKLTKFYGILPRAYFIYGSPGETPATIDQSIDLMEKLGPLSTVFYLLVVFPGTHLYTLARQKFRVSDDIWFEKIEDLPWLHVDPRLDFTTVKAYGDRLRQAFFKGLPQFVRSLELIDDTRLYSFHADFLSRLAMTFSQGEYATDPRLPATGSDSAQALARHLFEKALTYAPDARAFLGLAMGFQKQRNFSSAAAILEKGLKAFPGHKELQVCMGVCLMNQGDFKNALTCFTPFDSDPSYGHYISICKSRLTAHP